MSEAALTGDLCGTLAGYRRHLYYHQVTCVACCAAKAADQRARRAVTWTPPPLKPCGTAAAYRRHLRHRETPCRECCDAHAAEIRRWYHERRAAA